MSKIGLALSGGGSRAIAFHLGCFKTLNYYGLLDKIDMISSVSGGSVIAGAYCYSDYKNFEEFEEIIIQLLKKGLVTPGLKKYIKRLPKLMFNKFFNGDGEPTNRTHVFSEALDDMLFNKKLMRENNLDVRIVINSYDLVTNSCFRAGNKDSGTYKLGLVKDNKVLVSNAVTASAAHPLWLSILTKKYVFSNGKERKLHLVDGGIYDNSGLSCFDPTRNGINSDIRVDKIIALDASHGIFGNNEFPYYFFPRMSHSVGSIMRKHQDQFKKHLFSWKNSNLIESFAYIYLGQNDDSLPYMPDNFIKNFDKTGIGTDFFAMDEDTIKKLILRGQHLSKILLDEYGFFD